MVRGLEYIPEFRSSRVMILPLVLCDAIMFTAGLGRGEDARGVLNFLEQVQIFRFSNNPWECPPASVVDKGLDWMKKYYDELERADPVMIDTRKVVFIGESGAGKTRCDYECNQCRSTLGCDVVDRNVLHLRHYVVKLSSLFT